MKIKTWLMNSYLIVMILPVVSAYLFYHWFQSYYNNQALYDFLEAQSMITELEEKLQDPLIYLEPEKYQGELREFSSDYQSITLFSAYGDVLFTTLESAWSYSRQNPDTLYRDLYELQSGLRAYTIKKPVFMNKQIVGFYEIKITRVENIQNMEQRRNWIIALFILCFVMIYSVVILIMKRKFTIPLKQLMDEMSRFALGEKVRPIHAKRDEIGELIRHFSKMRELIDESRQKVKESQKEKEYMIASISHDLKTPLTSMRAYSESLKSNDLLPEEKRDYLDIIINKADYMKQMLDDLTVYTLLQSEDKSFECVDVDAEEFFEMLFNGYEELCVHKQIKLTIAINVVGAIHVNSKQMIRVIDNLFANALNHTLPHQNIRLGAFSKNSPMPKWILPPFTKSIEELREDGLIFIVQNEGEFIPEEEQEKVFQPLYQIEQARTKSSKGTGLGLSIAQKIIEKHGGTIHLLSKEGYGTTFVCWLPYSYEGENE